MRINLAGVLLTSGRTEEAFQAYGRAQVLAGDQQRLAEEARDGMSRILEARRQWRERTGEEPPEDFTLPVAFLTTAERARREGRLDEAEKVYEQLLASDPTMIAALHGRGQVRLARGDLTGAEADFVGGLATATGRQAAVLWIGLAEVERRRGDASGSLESLDSAVAADPSYAPGRYERGLARIDAKDYAGGEDDLRLAADSGRLPPAAEADASYQLGVLAFARGDAGAARARLERCRALAPDHPYVDRALARLDR